MYISKNEPEHFSYGDCVIKDFRTADGSVSLVVEALIVEPENSQNANFTRSYADRTTILFENGTVMKAVKEGYKKYDADDRLMEEIPDEQLDDKQTADLLSNLPEQYLYDLKGAGESEGFRNMVLGIEMKTDDITGIDADSYQILIRCGDMTVSWERYLNRV